MRKQRRAHILSLALWQPQPPHQLDKRRLLERLEQPFALPNVQPITCSIQYRATLRSNQTRARTVVVGSLGVCTPLGVAVSHRVEQIGLVVVVRNGRHHLDTHALYMRTCMGHHTHLQHAIHARGTGGVAPPLGSKAVVVAP